MPSCNNFFRRQRLATLVHWAWYLQAVKELEAAEKAKQEAKKEAASQAAATAEGKKEGEGNKLTKTTSNPSPKQSPKSGEALKADAGKGPEQGAKQGKEEDDESIPRDAEGNELAVDLDTSKLTAAQLQEELTKRGLDVKWQPLKGKKVLVERLQVNIFQSHTCPTDQKSSFLRAWVTVLTCFACSCRSLVCIVVSHLLTWHSTGLRYTPLSTAPGINTYTVLVDQICIPAWLCCHAGLPASMV